MVHRQSYACSRRERGFTLIELLVSIVVAAALLAGAYLMGGRYLTHNKDAQAAAAANGMVKPQVVRKELVKASSLGCEPEEEVGFLIKSKEAGPEVEPTVVCCRSWAKANGCRVK